MKQRTLALVATLIALVLVAGTSGGWILAAQQPTDQPTQGGPQPEEIDVEAWLSETGSTDPAHRLVPGTTQADVHVQSDLDEAKDGRIEVIDFRGFEVFRSDVFTLNSGQDDQTVVVTGKAMLQGYLAILDEQKYEPIRAIDNSNSTSPGALQVMEQEAAKDPCTFNPGNDDPSLRTNPARVGQHVGEVIGKARFLDTLLEQILRFESLNSSVVGDLNAARTELATVDTRAQAAIDKLQVPDDAPLCPDPLAYDIEIPNWEPNWDAVRADLNAALTAANAALSDINSGAAAIDANATRAFPTTSVPDECNQNTVQLSFRRTLPDSSVRWEPATDFWWTVGTPRDPARIASPDNPNQPANLSVQPATIYASSVTAAGVPHQSQVGAVVQDSRCVPVASGVTVNFTAGEEALVTLSSSQVTTDENGMVEVTANATADVGEGTAHVIACLGEDATCEAAEVQASEDIRVIGPPTQVMLRLAGRDVDRVPNFGITSSVQVTAVIDDANGNDVADGTPVQFSIDPGNDHTITNPTVTTAGGRAVAQLIFGTTTGAYYVQAQSGGVSDVQEIRVVGPPDTIQVEADPQVINVNTPLPERRQSQFTVEVLDSEGNPAPDSTKIDFEIEPSSFAGVGGFQGLTEVEPGVYETTNLTDGQTQATFVANSGLIGHYPVTIRVTATYTDGGSHAPVDTTVSLFIYNSGSETLYLPLVRRN